MLLPAGRVMEQHERGPLRCWALFTYARCLARAQTGFRYLQYTDVMN